ncbi:MAG: HD-GYP domain-containing protein, partial [Gallionella sp.]
GGRLLANHPLANLAIDAVVGHHERPDGKGYPHGIAGEVIPEVARIVSIADAFDAMTSTRAYRKGMPLEKAMNIIGAELGSQFDTQLGHHFLALDRSHDIAVIVGHSELGMPLIPCPNCSTPVVIKKSQHDGAHIYCRVCGGESRLHKVGDSFRLDTTGQMGDASVLAPDSDPDLIGAMVADIAPHVL